VSGWLKAAREMGMKRTIRRQVVRGGVREGDHRRR